MVFEGIVADLVVRYLGTYVRDLNKEQLKIGVFSGNLVLRDLEIKGEALQSLNLPITVKKGMKWDNIEREGAQVVLDQNMRGDRGGTRVVLEKHDQLVSVIMVTEVQRSWQNKR